MTHEEIRELWLNDDGSPNHADVTGYCSTVCFPDDGECDCGAEEIHTLLAALDEKDGEIAVLKDVENYAYVFLRGGHDVSSSAYHSMSGAVDHYETVWGKR